MWWNCAHHRPADISSSGIIVAIGAGRINRQRHSPDNICRLARGQRDALYSTEGLANDAPAKDEQHRSGKDRMSKGSKGMIVGSMVAAGAVGIASAVDLVVGIPFSGHRVMDVLFLISSGLVLYMGYDSYKDLV
jgi:hypothetical protein